MATIPKNFQGNPTLGKFSPSLNYIYDSSIFSRENKLQWRREHLQEQPLMF